MRELASEERALWAKVIATVKPLARTRPHVGAQEADRASSLPMAHRAKPVPAVPQRGRAYAHPSANTLDASWDRRLARGLVRPDVAIDLHGHGLAAAHGLLDRQLDRALAANARVVLLITGKPPRSDRRPVERGAIRAAIGDWLHASRYADSIAAVRPAHSRHGGAGALYLILRRHRAGERS